jgi:hypothetical protein
VLGAAAVVLVLLGPAIFLSSREPFNRLMEFLDLLLGGAEVTRRQLLAASDDSGPRWTAWPAALRARRDGQLTCQNGRQAMRRRSTQFVKK